jgi:hypothetical protein
MALKPNRPFLSRSITMSSVKDKVTNAAETVADTAKNVGHKIAAGASQATNYVKEMTGVGNDRGIKERMDVIASCGKKIGVVDHVEAGAIKLTRKDSPDGQHHFIPTAWVDHVDTHVHLTRNSLEAELAWKSDAGSCGCS